MFGIHSFTFSLLNTPAFLRMAMAKQFKQGIDGSARKPALRQDTGYMVEKTYLDIAPYLGAFGAYVMPQ